MIEHQGINWPTKVSQDLIHRLQESSTTIGLPVAIAKEIHELGTEFEDGSLKSFQKTHSLSHLVYTAEASGYARVGHEIIYFQEPRGRYIPIQEFVLDSKTSNVQGPWIDITPVVKRMLITGDYQKREDWDAVREPQLTSHEVSEHMKDSQIVGRKLDVLNERGYDGLLEDLLREANEEYKRRDLPSPYPEFEHAWKGLNLLGHAIRGIRAAMKRYEQLHNACTLDTSERTPTYQDMKPQYSDSNASPTGKGFMEELEPDTTTKALYLIHPVSRAVISALGASTVQLSDIVKRTNLPREYVISMLMRMKIKNIVLTHIDEPSESQRSVEAVFWLNEDMRNVMSQLESQFDSLNNKK